MSTFLKDYTTCALWSSTDNADESGGAPLDANYDRWDIAPATRVKMTEDCEAFEQDNAADLAAYQEATGYTGGHDFWLTRNGHGVGFWDRGLGALGKRLSDAAKVYRGFDLYIGDDGKVHGQ